MDGKLLVRLTLEKVCAFEPGAGSPCFEAACENGATRACVEFTAQYCARSPADPGCAFFRPTPPTINLMQRVADQLSKAAAWDQQVDQPDLLLSPGSCSDLPLQRRSSTRRRCCSRTATTTAAR